MKSNKLIDIKIICASHNIEISFVNSLHENGLIEMTTVEESVFFDPGQLQQLEKIIRFYYDLDINLEGIETITHLLKRINSMQSEIIALKNRIRLYETNE